MPFSWWKHNPPPLINPVNIPKVLSSVLINLSSPDLGKCRLVSTLWNVEVCKILRKTRVIEFTSLDSLSSYIAHHETTLDFPHSSYEFDYCTLREIKAEARPSEILKTFFDLFGSCITFLHLSIEQEFFGTTSLRHILENNVPNLTKLDLTFSGEFRNGLGYSESSFTLPHLTNLTVDILSYESLVVNAELIVSDILLAAPNLRRVSSEDMARHTSPILAEVLTQSVLSVPPGKLSRITHLEFFMTLSNDALSILQQHAFPLQTCYLDLKSSIDTENLQQFLINVSLTLHKLHLEFPQDDLSTHAFRFVVPMRALTFLSLSGFQGTLDLLGNLPDLHTLELRNTNLDKVVPHQQFSTMLISLELMDNCGDLGKNVMKRIATFFPTLRRLHLTTASNEILMAVYEALPFLEELDAKGDGITDEGVCGIPDKISKQITDAESFTGFAKYANYFRQFPHIGYLKNLHSLNLESNSISNVAVIFGLMQCEHLSRLRLASFLGLLSEISLQAIAEHENLTHANIYMPSHGWVDFKRMKKSKRSRSPSQKSQNRVSCHVKRTFH